MKTWLTLIAALFLASLAHAEEYTGLRSILREHVKHDGQVDATLASTTGWNSVQGFSWQMFLVDDISGATTLTRYNREFPADQAFKLKIEAHTDLWIYVMNVEPTGKMVTLLPELGEQHMQVKSGKTVTVPPDGHFRFTGDPGVEQFRVVASPVKLKWINPESLWKLENGAELPPDEERVAVAARDARHKSITGIKSLQEKQQEASGGLYTKSLPDLVETLEKNPDMRAMVKDVVLVPPPSEASAEAPEESHRQDVILVSDETESEDAIVIDIKLKHK
jgi:hypothetical protein